MFTSKKKVVITIRHSWKFRFSHLTLIFRSLQKVVAKVMGIDENQVGGIGRPLHGLDECSVIITVPGNTPDNVVKKLRSRCRWALAGVKGTGLEIERKKEVSLEGGER